ncbi:MAG: hypothetical protein LBI96_03570 [Odoribacteraceae bacterium]|jgi:hypothetical protein|nr:hypothetical protein [Odoribacteraceae bacterium]
MAKNAVARGAMAARRRGFQSTGGGGAFPLAAGVFFTFSGRLISFIAKAGRCPRRDDTINMVSREIFVVTPLVNEREAEKARVFQRTPPFATIKRREKGEKNEASNDN